MAFNCYMHPRNIYRTRPDFKQLASEYPEFSEYAITDERDRVHVNFKDANSLRCLTKTLLKRDFGLEISIPVNYLIPTVPQRLNYILWIEDLLCALPCADTTVNGIDIGTGPCCIFSVLGARKNGWKFLATESEEESFQWASKNISDNDLQEQVKLCKVDKDVILKGAVCDEDKVFDFCMCNPPFFHDPDELYQRRKIQIESEVESMEIKQNEVIVQGGEVEFIRKMIRDSVDIREKIRIYTSMFGKKKSHVAIKNYLKKVGNVNYTFTEFCQGNTMRWGVAWTFMKGVDLSQVHCSKRKKKKKPINFLIPKSVKGYSIKKLLQQIIAVLEELSIQYEIKTETRLNVLLLIKSNEDTWSHQRRKRRQALHLAKNDQSKPEDDKIILVTSTASPANNNIEKLSDSHIADEKEGGCNVSGINSCMECSETPLEMELIEHMDTEVLSDDEKVCSRDAEDSETASLGNKLAEDGVEVKSHTTLQSTSDMDFCSVVEESISQAVSCKAVEDAYSGTSSENLSVSIKRILDQEDLVEDCSIKRVKSDFGEMQDISSAVPLLFCNLELKRHCDKIMLEMSCEEQFHRQSMSEVLQLFKNRLK